MIFVFTLVFISCNNEKAGDISTEIYTVENGLLPAIFVKDDSLTKFNILERMDHYKVPGVSIAIVENGEVKWAKGYGIANTESGSIVDTKTIFQAGSISKPLAALSALKLVENGNLDLNEDVNTYLTDWKIP